MSHALPPRSEEPEIPLNALGHLRRRRVVGASMAAVAAQRAAAAQQPWPDRPVRLIAALPAGSGLDLVARAIAPALAARFGQPFVVDNRPGAGGIVAATAVALATDGHTLGLSINEPVTTARLTTPNLAFDPARDFRPVSLLYRVPFVLAAPAASPHRSLADLLAGARTEPGGTSYASIGAGSIGHLLVEEMAARHGVRMTHVPYRGFNEMTLDLLGGRVAFGVNTYVAAMPAVAEGRLRGLAVTSARRAAMAPDVPTVAEAGEPGAECYGWVGLVGPADLPPARAEELAVAVRAALAVPEGRAGLERVGAEFVASSPAEFAALLRAETERWSPVISRLGLRVVGRGKGPGTLANEA